MVNSVDYMVMHLTVCFRFLVLFTCLVIGLRHGSGVGLNFRISGW